MIINEKYMKQYSPIPLNYNMAEVKNYIPVAEKIWVIPLIGSDLFEEIDEQVENADYIFAGIGSGGTISGIGKYMKENNKLLKYKGGRY